MTLNSLKKQREELVKQYEPARQNAERIFGALLLIDGLIAEELKNGGDGSKKDTPVTDNPGGS